MGLIREPKGVDLLVGPSVLTEADRTMISAVIAEYKKTGKVPARPVRVKMVTRKAKRRKKKGAVNVRVFTILCRGLFKQLHPYC